MKCNEFRSLLSLLERGELDPAGQQAGERHARECPACRALLRETREAADATRRAAAADAQTAEAMLEGFEDRVLARLRCERRAAALQAAPAGKGSPWRLAFGLSLAFNLCAAALFGVFLLRPGAPEPWPARRPVGMPAAGELSNTYGELEALFGERLNWVAECGGKLAMGIIHDPGEVPAEGGARGPLVALVYWLDAAGGEGDKKQSAPMVILTRPGRTIRDRIPMEGAAAPVEIAVEAFTPRRGAYAIRTEVRPVAGAAGRQASSALAAAVDLQPGVPTKLGEVRLGDRMYDTFLAVQTLKEAGCGDDHSI